jgi:L-fucose isomerase-like protein
VNGAGAPRPRVGLLVPRFTAFDAVLGPERVARLRERGPAFAEALRPVAEVVFPGVVETPEQAAAAGAAFTQGAVEAVVVAPAMAAPPGLGMTALGSDPPPVVLWNAIGADRLPDEVQSPEAIEHTTSVGCQMLAGALARAGRAAAVITTGPGPEGMAQVHRAVVAAAAAGSLHGRAVVRIGDPPPGYVNVLAGVDDLARLGLRPVFVEGDELFDAFAATTAAEAEAVLDELEAAGLRGERGPSAERSARLARTVEVLLDRHEALCGAVNCLGPLLAGSERIGTVACLAAVRETARGRPLACTADVPAAIAMHLGRRLGGAALYGEWYVSEPATGSALFLGDGGADPAWAAPDAEPRLVETQLRGVHGPGLGLAADLRQGPATLLALGAAGDGWRLAWATGTAGPARSHALRGPNVLFRPDGGDALQAVSALIASGTTHHPVLVPGHLDVELPALAGALGLQSVRIGT